MTIQELRLLRNDTKQKLRESEELARQMGDEQLADAYLLQQLEMEGGK